MDDINLDDDLIDVDKSLEEDPVGPSSDASDDILVEEDPDDIGLGDFALPEDHDMAVAPEIAGIEELEEDDDDENEDEEEEDEAEDEEEEEKEETEDKD